MVIYRVIEKLHLTHIVDRDVVSYIIACVGTIVGAVFFSVIAQKCIKEVKSERILSFMLDYYSIPLTTANYEKLQDFDVLVCGSDQIWKYQVFLWEDGHLYRIYLDNGELCKAEYMYIHFFCRPMKYVYGDEQCNRYIMYPDIVKPYTNAITENYVKRNGTQGKLIFLLKMIWYNRKKFTVEKILKNLSHAKGVSMVIGMTEKGKMLFDLAKQKMFGRYFQIADLYKSQKGISSSAPQSPKHDFFLANVKPENFDLFVKRVTKLSIYRKVRRFAAKWYRKALKWIKTNIMR